MKELRIGIDDAPRAKPQVAVRRIGNIGQDYVAVSCKEAIGHFPISIAALLPWEEPVKEDVIVRISKLCDEIRDIVTRKYGQPVKGVGHE